MNVAENVRQAVLRVVCERQQVGVGLLRTMGTGFLRESGNVITAAHIVLGCDDVRIHDCNGRSIIGSVVARSVDLDVAVVTPSVRVVGLGTRIECGLSGRGG